MKISAQVFKYGTQEIKYLHKTAMQDRRHLVVIFSGYRERETYDLFGSSTSNLKCDILWIEDWFENNHAYYIRTGESFWPAEGVQALIEKVLDERKLSKNECTLAGFSKGASASLYHGLKYNYKNIISAAPRMNLGSSNLKRHPDVFKNMTKEGSQDEVDALDKIIPDLIKRSNDIEKNIYLFSSPSDYQYKNEIHPFLNDYQKYNNFNYIETDSPLVKEHIDVTWYNLPLIVSTLTALSEGAVPRYGVIHNGDTARSLRGGLVPSIAPVKNRNEVVAGMSSMRIREGKLFPVGWAFIKGYDASTYGSIRRELRIHSPAHESVARLGGLHDNRKSSQFFENRYIDYSKTKFASIGERGIDISSIPDGRYSISINLKHANIERVIRKFEIDSLGQRAIVGKSLAHLETIDGELYLIKQPAYQVLEQEAHFEVRSTWMTEKLIHVEGIFAVLGQPASRWDDVSYYLISRNETTGETVSIQKLAKDSKSSINNFVESKYIDYSKAYFTTNKYSGIDLRHAPNELVGLYVTLATKGGVFSHRIDMKALPYET